MLILHFVVVATLPFVMAQSLAGLTDELKSHASAANARQQQLVTFQFVPPVYPLVLLAGLKPHCRASLSHLPAAKLLDWASWLQGLLLAFAAAIRFLRMVSQHEAEADRWHSVVIRLMHAQSLALQFGLLLLDVAILARYQVRCKNARGGFRGADAPLTHGSPTPPHRGMFTGFVCWCAANKPV